MTDSIFRPIFDQDSSGIKLALSEIDRQRWLFENMLVMPKHHAWMRRDVSIKRAIATTSIENVGLDEQAVRQLLKRGPSGKPDEAEQANINALRAYGFVDYLSDQADIPIDELVIRQLNREFMYGAPEDKTPGVYRNGHNEIPGFQTPNQGDVPDLMRSFALWLREDETLEPVLKAGIAHLHLVAIHPFWDGNGRTARGISTLILQRSGFGFKGLLSLEAVFAGIRDDYFTAIERTLGSTFTPEYDSTTWLEFFAKSVLADALRLTATLTDWHRMMEPFYANADAMGLNFRQVDALAYAMQTGRITRGDYIEITNASPVTASRDLAELANRGLLRAEGRTRSRIYIWEPPEPSPEKAPPPEQARMPLEVDS